MFNSVLLPCLPDWRHLNVKMFKSVTALKLWRDRTLHLCNGRKDKTCPVLPSTTLLILNSRSDTANYRLGYNLRHYSKPQTLWIRSLFPQICSNSNSNHLCCSWDLLKQYSMYIYICKYLVNVGNNCNMVLLSVFSQNVRVNLILMKKRWKYKNTNLQSFVCRSSLRFRWTLAMRVPAQPRTSSALTEREVGILPFI